MKTEQPKTSVQQMLTAALSSFERSQNVLNQYAAYEGRDPHTGTNAQLTLAVMAQAINELDASASWHMCFETAAVAGIKNGSGDIGILLTAMMISWCDRLKNTEVFLDDSNSAILGKILAISPWDACVGSPEFTRNNAHVPQSMNEQMRADAHLEGTDGQTFSAYVLRLHEMLIDTGNGKHQSSLDSHFACIALLASCCASVLEHTDGLDRSLCEMLIDLAPEQTFGHVPMRTDKNTGDQRFIVEIVMSSTHSDLEKTLHYLDECGAYYAYTGIIDPFNVGTWRFYVETDSVTTLYPNLGYVHHFQVRDARADDVIGEDGLAAEFLGQGTHLLEARRPHGAQRVVVHAMTRCVGLVHDIAQTGATVILYPSDHVYEYLISGRLRSSSGVHLMVPCDAQSRQAYVEQINIHGEPDYEVVAESTNDLVVLDVARACARLFDPEDQRRPTERHGLTRHMLLEASGHATGNSRVVELPSAEESSITARIFDVMTTHPHRLRLLVGAGDDEGLVGSVRQILATTMTDGVQIEVIDGGHVGPSILQGHR